MAAASLQPRIQLSIINMHWYCIHTRPQKEDATCLYYNESLGIETYFPKFREQRTIRRVKRIVTRPLFPRYLFCRFEPTLHYRAVRYAPDVIDIVRCGSAPAMVPDAMIDELRRWADPAFQIVSAQPSFRQGDAVIIEDGPLMGLSAVVQQEMTDTERVAVLLSFLDCGARLMIPRTQLRLVS
jgi:transcriptional antiterminator RfaH